MRARTKLDEGQAYVKEIRLKRDAVASFDKYPFHLAAVRHLDRLPLHPRVTYLVGENGSGKSTLLEAVAIAYGFNAEGGSRDFVFSTRESHSELSEYLMLAKGVVRPSDGFFLRAESFFNVATEIENLGVGGSYGGTSLHEQSHGESFFSLIMHRFRGRGLYLLDEPEAALSPTRQMAMLARLHDLVRNQSQFIIATHSPIILAYPNALIYQLTDEGIRPVAYTDTDQFVMTRAFLNNREQMLDTLLNDGGPERRGSNE